MNCFYVAFHVVNVRKNLIHIFVTKMVHFIVIE